MKQMLAILVVISFIVSGIVGAHFMNGVKMEERESFDSIIEKVMKFGKIPAMNAAIIKNGKVVWAKGYGYYDIENGKRADVDTIYLVASISKTVTATAIMQLYERGLLNIDDDVNKYLPFPLRNPKYPDKPITIRMLLSHHSSLSVDPPGFYAYIPGDFDVPGYPYPWLENYLVPGKINYKPQVWSDYMPGEKLQYANVGYSILGYVVERVSGMSFEEYCQKNIFSPLNMKNTSFRLANINISRLAVPYVLQNNELYPLLQYGIIDYPAGGLRTNLIDLSHFLIAHMDDGMYNGIKILNKSSVEEMHRIQYPGTSDYNFDYGLGWQIWKNGMYVGHTGGLYGVATKMVYRKEDNTGIIYFLNRGAEDVRGWIAYSVIEKLLFWKADGMKGDVSNLDFIETLKENEHMLKEKPDYSWLNRVIKMLQ